MASKPAAGERTIKAFLTALGQRSPAPGGGAAAALAGAMGASLAAMVARYSTKRPAAEAADEPAAPDALARIAAQLDEARDALLSLADEDAVAYQAVARAYSLPRDEAGREEAIKAACAAACAPPAAVAERAADSLRLLAERADGLNTRLASDLAISADLLLAAAHGAERLARVNATQAGKAAAGSLEAVNRAVRAAEAAHHRLIAMAQKGAAG